MKPLNRRRAIKLASPYLLVPPARQRQPGADRIHHRSDCFEMANFLGPRVDADTAFAKALALISTAASDPAKAAGPAHIVFNLGKNATYRINRPLAFKRAPWFRA
jgi:hypothetical protein